MSSEVDQSLSDLELHLREQVGFMCRSASAFDAGHEDEAKRLAVVIRVLFHDTPQSRSLIGQLQAGTGLLMYDTVGHVSAKPSFTVGGLTMLHAHLEGSTTEAQYVPLLENGPPNHPRCLRPLADWWSGIVIQDVRGQAFSRRAIVLAVANKDGGAHVDPSLDEAYAALTRGNSMNWRTVAPGGAEADLPGPHLATVRQIAHEVLTTIALVRPQSFADAKCLDAHRVVDLSVLPQVVRKAERNEPCPCGSAKKYKRCHGRA